MNKNKYAPPQRVTTDFDYLDTWNFFILIMIHVHVSLGRYFKYYLKFNVHLKHARRI